MTIHSPAIQNSIHTQGKLKLNLHSLSVSEFLEYRRKSAKNLTVTVIFSITICVFVNELMIETGLLKLGRAIVRVCP